MWKSLVLLVVVANIFFITPSEASRKKCPPNEEFDLCPAPCPPRECGVNKALILCAPSPKIGDPACEPGCRCSDGFLRNKDGDCVPEKECPIECPKNETLDPCFNPCPPRYCGVSIDMYISCASLPEDLCEPGCRCKDGYLRNAEGFCIKKKDCPVCTRENEVYDVCPAPCPPRRCDVDERTIRCAAPPKPGDPECEPGCRCADGFVRNSEGKCVTRDQCPIKCPKNETLDPCLNTCPPRLCGVNIAAISCAVIPEELCEPGCRCKDGYLRNAEGFCIKEKDCPKCRGQNEVYDVCPAPCPPRRCDVDERLIRCAAPPKPGDPECEPGCRCADGYVRNPDGVCVTRDQCPPNCGRHEVYSTCPIAVCRPQQCSEVGFPIACPFLPRGFCPSNPACICDVGFVRNGTGPCIPVSHCPSCGGDINAVSGCGVNCGRHCSDRNKMEPVFCIQECRDNACDCRKGFRFDDNIGKCVRPKECTPTCGKDEVYSDCINGGCQPKNCSQLGYPVPCIKIDPKFCIKGCLCKEDYLRADNGTCIPKTECPSCGGDSNAVSGCGVNCGKHCSDLLRDEPVACSDICKLNGCDCKEGFVEDDSTGKCIRPEECVSCKGDVNAMPGCDRECKNRCPGPQPKECKCPEDSCKCKIGFVFDPITYKCVRPEQCTPVCGTNEVFSSCSNGGCGPWTCDDLGFPTGCVKMPPENCREGCVCQEGFVRDSVGNCIPSIECPECGGDPNARAGCGINCGRLCSNWNKGPVACPAVCLENACDCKDDYVFDQNIQRCVLPQDCTPVCGEKEMYSECINGGCQPKNCSQLGKPVPCIKIDPKYCIKGCLCIEGYLRAPNGTCVPKDQCPAQCLKPNKVYDPCPPICPPQTCESIDKKYFCPRTPDCKGACRCKPNYFRNKRGECISKEDCLKCTGPNEYFSCGVACDNVCATMNKQNQTNCPIKNIVCNPMCYCNEGYARNENKTCIPIEDCPVQCGDNERLEICPDRLCIPQSCEELGFPLNCSNLLDDPSTPCPGPPACVCDFNFVRNKHGKCIPSDQCPSCGGDPNAKPGCGINCGRLCSNYNKGPVACPRICKVNACDCKKDYVLDENIKKCVLPKHCTPVCKDNEVYSECINGGCRPKNCSQLGKPVPCVKIDPKYCIKGCLCIEGYLRAANGTCVPEDQCDHCNRPHEHYDPCPPTCPPQTCESIGKKYNCPLQPQACKGACRCDDGFFRNKKGECIAKTDCLKCKGPHEYFSCGGACDNVCADLYKQNQTNCPIVNIVCNPMCYCAEGYARDINKICIPIDECPVPICGENERLEQCPPYLCTPQDCSQLGFPIACPDLSNATSCPEPPGCVCIDNYVRDDCGKCIPSNQCPSCGGDPNAVAGCGVNCGRLCSNYKRKDVVCPEICFFNACDCRKGYVYDENLKKCVRPKHCTPVCGKYEVYDTCANGGCDKRNCSQVGDPTLSIDPIKCIGGCVCQKGYLRTNDGVCVPEDQCPPKCTQPHEIYDPCAPSCPPQTCESIGKVYPCPLDKICRGACRCEKGYYRNKKNECILESECLQCTGPNEFFSCGVECDNVCATLSQQNQTNCPIKNKKCNPQCYCEKDYARDANKVCIPIEQCGVSCKGDPNAVPGCSNHCGNRCSDYKDVVVCPLFCELNGCDCKQNYVFDDNLDICVQPKNCSPICGKDEVYNSCINGGCQKKFCSDLGQPDKCVRPKKCIQGCLCNEGLLRAENGTCVPISECPAPTCPNDNEVYDTCANGGCSRRKCSELTDPIICRDVIECIGDCVCIEGYLRNYDGVCVPEDQCNPQCGPNEVYTTCTYRCPPQTCESLDRAYICPIETGQEPPCESGCVCQDGFYRNILGECISEANCLKCMGPQRPHEYFTCGGECDNVCETINVQSQDNCPIVNIQCNEKCYCQPGYARNSSNICIPIEDCPTPICPYPNEVYDTCANGGCNRRECSELSGPIICRDPIECIGDCVCIKGYLRNQDGDCVPEDQCNPQCGPNEVYTTCTYRCPPQTCESLDRAYICPIETGQEPPCESGCVCQDGFYRNILGECISEANCLKCMGPQRPHEYFTCGGECDNVCETINVQSQDNCPIVNIQCNEKCYCQPGYARNSSNICIPIEDCPTPICPYPNEVYDTCANGGCNRRECSELSGPIICRDPIECIGDCVCIKGYLRNQDGDCVPEDQCNPQCGPNEVFTTCTYRCPPQTCESLDRAYICPIETGQEPPCESGCVCQDGFYRNILGECISEANCLKCMGPRRPNEYFTCGGVCDNVCETLNEQSQDDCPIVNIQCNKKCYCKPGHARNSSNICIPIEDCPPSRCGPNERYEENPSMVCEPLTCEEVGWEMKCPPVEDPDCDDTPTCICKYGLVRNKDGTCIPISECPSTNTTAPPTTVNVTEARARYDKGSIDFTNEVLYELLTSKPNENIVASGPSVVIPVALLSCFTKKDSNLQKQLFKLINLNNVDEIKAVFSGLLKEYNSEEQLTLEIANKLYANEQYLLTNAINEVATQNFSAETQNLNFGQTELAAKTINDWVDSKTHGKIKDLVKASMFNEDTRLVVINAIYFLGNWIHQFNENRTKMENFTKSNGDIVPLEMMYQENNFDYAENDLFQALQLRYKGNSASLLIVLPQENNDVKSAVEYFKGPTVFSEFLDSMTTKKVQVTLPKFKIDFEIDFDEILKKLGYPAMFDPANNGFEGILQDPQPLFVSKIFQKAFIEVNEKGTEAAAATAIILTYAAAIEIPQETIVFDAVRSFAFYILLDNVPLFCGTFVGAQ